MLKKVSRCLVLRVYISEKFCDSFPCWGQTRQIDWTDHQLENLLPPPSSALTILVIGLIDYTKLVS